ncbi:MAG: sigma-54 dependent transcriptional regulator [Marinisporobacter sp.]|jgi:two-component system response regulator AtoC|nr:sigma-54 dependent transcriptional regulator [Marinisporobacter sp.]
MKKIFIIDDHKEISDLLERILIKDHFDARAFYDASSAIEAIRKDFPDLILLDVQMPHIDGVEALKSIKKICPSSKVIIITAYAEKQKSNYFLENGAIDFIAKPFKLKDIRKIIANILSEDHSHSHTPISTTEKIIGNNIKIKNCIDQALKLSNSHAPVLISGESGTGKELLVDFIHYHSVRKHHRLIKINCAAIPSELLESELFGYEKGAFTGAVSAKKGKFEEANQGTLFLDEICEMDIHLQTKLLRVIEYKLFERLGSNKEISSDFRLICATNRDIRKEIQQNRFRMDLFYRINTFNISLPPLRSRKEDINLLVSHFILNFKQDYITPVKKVSSEVLAAFHTYHWPGNIRQLKNIVEGMLSFANKEELTIEDLPACFHSIIYDTNSYKKEYNPPLTIEDLEREHIINILKKVNGNKKDAIQILGISEKTLYNKIKKYAIKL